MNTGTVLKLTFISGLLLTIVGGWFKIIKEPFADGFLLVALVLTAIFVLTALYEVFTSRRIHRSEKTLWALGFVFIVFLTGLFYLLSERRRIRAGA